MYVLAGYFLENIGIWKKQKPQTSTNLESGRAGTSLKLKSQPPPTLILVGAQAQMHEPEIWKYQAKKS